MCTLHEEANAKPRARILSKKWCVGGHRAVAMSTTTKSALPHGRCRAPILSFAAALRGRECPPNCLEIGGRPWRLSGSYEHVTDRREKQCVDEMYAERNPSCAGSVAQRLSTQVHPAFQKLTRRVLISTPRSPGLTHTHTHQHTLTCTHPHIL